ncbi:hypothetical protein AAC387_Pa02g0714 [Persea americana]
MDLNRFLSSFDPERDFQFYKEKAPPGYHFVATTSVMVFYLLLKEQGHPLANIFQEVPLNDYNPDELQRMFNKGKGDEFYLYTKIKPLKNGWRVERKAGSGRWKNLKRGEEISQGGNTIAYKTTLTYYVVNDGKEEKTCWSMHEYRLHRKKSERQMRDDVALCKIYKRGGAGKTSEAVDEETGGSIGSWNSLQSSTTVSNGLAQSFPDVHSLFCVETEDLVTPTNGSSDLLAMAAVNDPFQSVVSPIEDSGTPMNFYGDFPMAVNNSYLFIGSPIEDSVAPPMNAYGHFSILADVNDDALQFVGSPFEDLVTPMNVSGDFSMANAIISNDLWS